jgi:hypothetical protein
MGCIDPFFLVLPILGIGWGNPYGLDSEERSIHLLQTNGNLSRSWRHRTDKSDWFLTPVHSNLGL